VAATDVVSGAVKVMSALNRAAGEVFAKSGAVHALTDVTGFGLAGHLLELCRGAGVRAEIDWDALPFIPEAVDLVRAGVYTGASTRNFAGYGRELELEAGFAEWQKQLLTDPQTSGGLLVACSADAESRVLEIFRTHGFDDARTIGRVVEGAPGVTVRGGVR